MQEAFVGDCPIDTAYYAQFCINKCIYMCYQGTPINLALLT